MTCYFYHLENTLSVPKGLLVFLNIMLRMAGQLLSNVMDGKV